MPKRCRAWRKHWPRSRARPVKKQIPIFARAIDKAPSDEQGKRSLYFLLLSRAEGLEKLDRQAEGAVLRKKAAALLPKANPGEIGFHV